MKKMQSNAKGKSAVCAAAASCIDLSGRALCSSLDYLSTVELCELPLFALLTRAGRSFIAARQTNGNEESESGSV